MTVTIELLAWMESRNAEVKWTGADDLPWLATYLVPDSPHQHYAKAESNIAALSAAMEQDEAWRTESPMRHANEWFRRNGKTRPMRLV